ncbi:MAG TPA: hypothetical protein DC054_13885 [Blastocatellia bacterium]|nr:hypothetical protein [Blastocatellia bacterium]
MNLITMNPPLIVSATGKVADRIADAVDTSVLLSLENAQADGETDLIVELIDLYLDESARRLAAMSSWFEKSDVLSLRREAHSLKGSSATLGAAGTAELCQAIEKTTEDGPSQAVGRLLIALHQEAARAREAFLVERHRRLRPGSIN